MSADWRQAYHSMDASGEQGTCGQVAWEWIDALAVEQERLRPGECYIESHTSSDLCGVITLYVQRKPYAVATTFRTPFNWSCLVRWIAE